MGRLIEGKWTTQWYEPDEDGRFKRPDTVFRDRVTTDGSTRFAPEAGRYHLYVAFACPWAHRTLITRKLRGLEDVIDVSVVHPFMGDEGWQFDDSMDGCTPDRLHGHDYLREVYASADATYTGRVTVPVLWDTKHHTIVNNESKEVIRILDRAFDDLATRGPSLFPAELDAEIDAMIEANYEPVNNGVYRAGFADSQQAYEEAAWELFDRLDELEALLSRQRYLCGPQFTAADVCLFTTLLRFDPVYHTHFSCNLRRLRDYPNLWNYTLEIYQMPGVAGTVNLEQTKLHYYGSHDSIRPKRIVPIGPEIDYDAPHDRGRFG